MVLKEEQAAFSDWINNHLQADKDVSHLLLLNVSYCDKPTTLVNNIQETGSDLYEKMDDGILLCKMINLAAPDTIDERVINKGSKLSIFKVTASFKKLSKLQLKLTATREPDVGNQLSKSNRLCSDWNRQPFT